MNTIVQEIVADANAVLEKVIQAQVGLPAGVVDPVLVKVEGSIEAAIAHLGHKPATVADRSADGTVAASVPTAPATPTSTSPT